MLLHKTLNLQEFWNEEGSQNITSMEVEKVSSLLSTNQYEKIFARLQEFELRLCSWMESHGVFLLRMALGIVFFWFGALKPFGLSPAAELVAKTTFWIPIPHFSIVLGFWEMAIGLCFIYRPLIRVAFILLCLHMPGTMLPLVILPAESYVQFPFALTLEGQYIIKNLVLIGAAIVVGGKIRHQMQGFVRFAPEEFMTLLHRGKWADVSAGELIAVQDRKLEHVFFIHTGEVSIQRDREEIATSKSGQFVGEMSFLTNSNASATVKAMEPTRYICWDKTTLQELKKEEPKLYHTMIATINLDLVSKLCERKNQESDDGVPGHQLESCYSA